MSLISVIVPVYNTAEYLERCIRSVLEQTHVNLEVILVNDGSTDCSGDICDKWAKKDERIVVIHQKNAGVSAARNAGIEVAHGEYIGFVDSDDKLDANMYEWLLSNAVAYNADISCCQIEVVDENGKSRALDKNESRIYQKAEIIDGFFFDNFIRGFIVSPCNKILKKELIDTSHIRFKKYALAEDFLFIFELLQYAQNIYYDKRVGYYYLHRKDSAMTATFSPNRFDYVEAIQEIENLCVDMYDEQVQKKAHQWVFNNILINYRAMTISCLKDTYLEEASSYKAYLKENKKCFKNLNLKRKIDYCLTIYFPQAYRILGRLI